MFHCFNDLVNRNEVFIHFIGNLHPVSFASFVAIAVYPASHFLETAGSEKNAMIRFGPAFYL